MKILFTNLIMTGRTGTEMFLSDLAGELQSQGHEICIFTRDIGISGRELLENGIPVVSSLEEVPWIPDILHCHHSWQCLEAISKYPSVPAIYVCHDATAWFDKAPPSGVVSRYVAVDEHVKERVVHDTGVTDDEVTVIGNSINLRRFSNVRNEDASSGRALIFHSGLVSRGYMELIEQACAEANYQLDVAGHGSTLSFDAPEKELCRYGLVFSKARSAMEAMACGCAVIPAGSEGFAPRVDPLNFEEYRGRNFGRSLLTQGRDKEWLVSQIRGICPKETALVTERIRNECGLASMSEKYLRLYGELMDRPSTIDRAMHALGCYAVELAKKRQEELVRNMQH
jgi:hypothetical protein